MGKYTFFAIAITLIGSCSCSRTTTISEVFEDGSTETYEVNKKDSIRNGKYTFTGADGTVQSIGNFVNDLEDGEFVRYYEDGAIEEKVHYKAGEFHGAYEYFYKDGTLKQSCTYLQNKIEGILTNYYPDGKTKEEVTLKNGTEDGPFKEYYMNGQISTEGSYTTIREDAVEVGELIEYDSLGTITRKAVCEISNIGGYEVSTCMTTWPIPTEK